MMGFPTTLPPPSTIELPSPKSLRDTTTWPTLGSFASLQAISLQRAPLSNDNEAPPGLYPGITPEYPAAVRH